MLDVAVIGGGPVGSRAAFKLAVSGHQVIVFEKRPGIGEKLCCTGIVSQECVASFNILPELIFRKVNSALLFSPGGECIRIQRPDTQASIINRSAFDRALAEQAQIRGVEYHLSSEVKDIVIGSDRVQIEVDTKGKICQVEARAAVLATGFNAPLVKRLGFGQTPDSVVAVQAEVKSNRIGEIEVYFDQQLAKGFFGWLVPTIEGKCLAGIMSRDSPGQHLRNWLTNLAIQGKVVPEGYAIRYWGIPLKPLPKTFRDRLLVVGDAAGQVKPTTGGGIYFGMLCADMAAETLHNAINKGLLSADQLSHYERSWKAKLSSELKREYFARQLYQHLSDKQINVLISRAKSSGMVDSLMKEDISFDWHGGLMLKVLKAGIMSQVNRLARLPIRKG